MIGSSSDEKKVARPTVGDKVVVLDTNNTRSYCPELIGSTSEIVGDAEDNQPYQIADSGCWLHVEDVQRQESVSSSSKGATESIEEIRLIRLENEEDFNAKEDEAASKDKVVVVALFASWCRTCAALKPKYKRMIKDWPNVEFCDILLDNNKLMARKNGVKTIPYIWIFGGKKGKESFQMGPGKISKLKDSLQVYASGTRERQPMGDFSI